MQNRSTIAKKARLLYRIRQIKALAPPPTNWDDLRYCLVLAGQGSLSAAARVLAVEHSTVSRRLGALEQSLGARLFDRLPRGWQLTAEGRELLTQAERVDYEMQAFARAAAGLADCRA